jgi:hypothetical protein
MLKLTNNPIGTTRNTSGISKHFKLWEKRPSHHRFYSIGWGNPSGEWVTLDNIEIDWVIFHRPDSASLQSKYPYINRHDHNQPRGFYV